MGSQCDTQIDIGEKLNNLTVTMVSGHVVCTCTCIDETLGGFHPCTSHVRKHVCI